MSRHRSFWPVSGIKRCIPGCVNGQMLDVEVGAMGLRFTKRNSSECTGAILWNQVERIAAEVVTRKSEIEPPAKSGTGIRIVEVESEK